MLLNWAKNRTAEWLAGNGTDYPTYMQIGSGSGTVVASQVELLHTADRQPITAVDGSTAYKVKWTTDWNSVVMSGLGNGNAFPLWEWGMCTSGTGTTGSMWSRTAMENAVNFDGTTELRIQEQWEVY